MPDLTDLSRLEFAKDAPEEQRTLPADKLVEWVRANKKPVRIAHAVVTGAVDLAAVTFAHEFLIQDTTFRGLFDARDARFIKSLDLRGCAFANNVNFSGCRVEGSLVLSQARIAHRGRPPGAVPFGLLRVQGNLVADELVCQGKLLLSGADVAGNVDLTAAKITGGLDLEVAVIKGSLHCSLIEIRNSGSGEGQEPTAAVGVEKAPALPEDGSAFLGGIFNTWLRKKAGGD